jgi:hypothetical protein
MSFPISQKMYTATVLCIPSVIIFYQTVQMRLSIAVLLLSELQVDNAEDPLSQNLWESAMPVHLCFNTSTHFSNTSALQSHPYKLDTVLPQEKELNN